MLPPHPEGWASAAGAARRCRGPRCLRCPGDLPRPPRGPSPPPRPDTWVLAPTAGAAACGAGAGFGGCFGDRHSPHRQVHAAGNAAAVLLLRGAKAGAAGRHGAARPARPSPRAHGSVQPSGLARWEISENLTVLGGVRRAVPCARPEPARRRPHGIAPSPITPRDAPRPRVVAPRLIAPLAPLSLALRAGGAAGHPPQKAGGTRTPAGRPRTARAPRRGGPGARGRHAEPAAASGKPPKTPQVSLTFPVTPPPPRGGRRGIKRQCGGRRAPVPPCAACPPWLRRRCCCCCCCCCCCRRRGPRGPPGLRRPPPASPVSGPWPSPGAASRRAPAGETPRRRAGRGSPLPAAGAGARRPPPGAAAPAPPRGGSRCPSRCHTRTGPPGAPPGHQDPPETPVEPRDDADPHGLLRIPLRPPRGPPDPVTPPTPTDPPATPSVTPLTL
ncbi:basic proline-rich protein-like [Dromaius novaehollandiae]|uniref:basic proline-rich protein-like n=1 Tax=Dromaius novaehollandiae TaxID=8790 RepID=UPI00311F8A00